MTPWKRRASRDSIYSSPRTPTDTYQNPWTPTSESRRRISKSLFTKFRRSSDESLCSSPTPGSSPAFDNLSYSIKEILGVNKGPQIKLYSFSQSQNSDIVADECKECAVCDESIQHKLTLESILVLKCGHYIHEQCLNLLLEYEIQLQGINEIDSFATSCSQCHETIKLRNPEEMPKYIPTQIKPSTLGNKWRESVSSNTTTLDITRESLLREARSDRKCNIARTLLIASTVLTMTSDMGSVGVEYNVLVELYTRHMLRKCPSMPLHTLETLGPMRMADTLEVSLNGSEYMLHTVFLFADHIVIVLNGALSDYYIIGLSEPEIDINVSGIIVIRPREDLTPTISSDTACTKITKDGGSTSSLMEVCLAAEQDQVIQKWVIGVIDGTMQFPSELFSSTISLETISVR